VGSPAALLSLCRASAQNERPASSGNPAHRAPARSSRANSQEGFATVVARRSFAHHAEALAASSRQPRGEPSALATPPGHGQNKSVNPTEAKLTDLA
jgi:hypothetical protein